MTIELTSIFIAMFAGVLSVLSPCVWPLVPIVMTSASGKSRMGPLYLALGLSTSFAVSGAFLTYLLLSLGLNPDMFRNVAAVLLLVVGLILVIKPLSDWVTARLSNLGSGVKVGNGDNAFGQFGVGFLLGLVWLPCVGPTLGAAIAVASMGQNMGMAFLVMFAFGVGTASALLFAAFVSRKLLQQLRPGMFNHVGNAKKVLGFLLIVLAVLILSGLDKVLETYAVNMIPDWVFSL
jgi:cytochrome c-type biogenesis protein